MEPTTIAAEDAPLGVPLWPSHSVRRFTLTAVSVIRDRAGTRVIWLSADGTERTFGVGEQVTVRYPASSARFETQQRVIFEEDGGLGGPQNAVILSEYATASPEAMYFVSLDAGGNACVFAGELTAAGPVGATS